MGFKRLYFFGFLLVLILSFVSSSSIQDNLNLNIQVEDSGTVYTGTFDFQFNITDTSDCSGVLYDRNASLTTDSRGIITYSLPNVSLSFTEQYYLCIYRNGVLKYSNAIGIVPYAAYSKNVSAHGIIADSNLDLPRKNVTATGGLFSFLGSLVNRITNIVAQNIDVNGTANLNNVNVSGNMGIGTSSPTHSLNVVGNTNLTGLLFVNGTEANRFLYNMSDGSYNESYAIFAYNESLWLITEYGSNWYNHTSAVFNSIDEEQIYNHTLSVLAIIEEEQIYNHSLAIENMYGDFFYNMTLPANAYADIINLSLVDLINSQIYDNQSWNESYSNGLYAGIKWAHNQTAGVQVNTTQMNYSYGFLTIKESFLRLLGFITGDNVAFINETNIFTEEQNFSGDININEGNLNLNNNATISRQGVDTQMWISETGNIIIRYGA